MSEPTDMPYELESLLSADGDGPAPRIDAVAAQRLIAQAIDAAAAPRVAPLRIKRYGWLLAAALVITGSAAAMYTALHARNEAANAERAAATRGRPALPPSEPVVQPVAPAVPATAAQAAYEVQPATTNSGIAPALRGGAMAVAEPQAAAPAPVPSSRATQTQPATAQNGEGGVGVQDLLRRANRLRGEGRYRTAERTYLRVVAQSPSGAPAYSARVAAASLRIERLGDPRGALRLYTDALRAQPDGALAPEIHEGMAQAFRKLGQSARERQALNALLLAQSDGPAAERARARLQELDATVR